MAFRRKKQGDDSHRSGDMVEKPQGKIAQIRSGFKAIKQLDPNIGWWMALAAVVTLLVAVVIGFFFDAPVYALILGLPMAMLAATFVLNRRSNKAMYAALRGRPGGSGAALAGIRQKGWYLSREPVAVDVNRPNDFDNAAFVFRALGRPGVILVGEGPSHRVHRLLEKERKKVSRVAEGVPIHLFVVSEEKDDTPVHKLVSKVQRLRPQLSKAEVAVVNKRLKALPSLRAALPPGIDPNRVRLDRKAMRGR